MVAHPSVKHSFPRGRTANGDDIFIITWQDLEVFSQVQKTGAWYRTYCPIHGSDHQRSLSIKATTGFGHCFRCLTNVFVADFDPQLALRLQQREQQETLPSRQPALAHSPTPLQKRPLNDWQAEEVQILSDLHAQGALHLDRTVAWNAQAYLEARHIPVQVAIALGVGYLERGASERYEHRFLQRWEDRLLFPLATPGLSQADPAQGFAGRLIWHWQSCVDEKAHQRYLEQHERKRWIKTNPAGWFWEPQHLPTADPLIVVEGPFDRLAVLADGHFQAEEVVALVGTALQPHWLSGVPKVLLALDADQGGKEASTRIEQQLRGKQILVEVCSPQDDAGKDWSECYRNQGSRGLEILYAHQTLLAHDL